MLSRNLLFGFFRVIAALFEGAFQAEEPGLENGFVDYSSHARLGCYFDLIRESLSF